MEMNYEIIINEPEQGVANYSELVARATEIANLHKGIIVSQNCIAESKKDIANLRKLAKIASDTRIKIEREHAAKIDNIKSQLKELTRLFEDAANAQDTQIKAYELERRKAREDELREAYAMSVRDKAVTFEMVFDEKMLNASVTPSNAKKQLLAAIAERECDLEFIRDLDETEDRIAALIVFYRKNLYLNATLQYNRELSEAKAAEVAQPIEPMPEEVEVAAVDEPVQTITIIASVTDAQWARLESHMKTNGIIYDIIEDTIKFSEEERNGILW